jgi:hypothetical protein
MNNTLEFTLQVIRGIDWKAVADRTGTAARFAWFAMQLLTMAAVMMAEIAYENRQEIRQFAVKVIAFMVVAAETTYNAGVKTRAWVERMNDAATQEFDKVPATIAPIAGVTIAVAKSAATATVNWLGFNDVEPAPVQAPVQKTLEEQIEELMALPAATLREMAGTNRRYTKAKLVNMIVMA